ncbi:MAG: ComEA family DNA-binding protein [Oscillospiraceae bacterium]
MPNVTKGAIKHVVLVTLVAAVILFGISLFSYPPLWQNITPAENTAFFTHTKDVVNINTATVQELMVLPAIGEKRAEAIVSYRQQHGAFLNTEELMNVDGIGMGIFEDIKDLISIEE